MEEMLQIEAKIFELAKAKDFYWLNGDMEKVEEISKRIKELRKTLNKKRRQYHERKSN